MKVGDFLNNLASQAGVDSASESLKTLLANSDLSKAEIHDELAGKIQGNLLTIDSAKNNGEIKRYFNAMILNGVDSELKSTMTELQIPDETIAEINRETSSYKRVSLLAKKVKELEAAKSAAAGKNKDALSLQIESLNAEIKKVRDEKTAEVQGLISQHKQVIADMRLDNVFSGYDYASKISKEANIITAKTLFNQALKEKSLQIINDETGFRLETKDGTEYFENNVKVGLKDFADKVVAHHNLIQTSKPEPPKPPAPSSNGAPAPGAVNTNKFAAAAAALANEAMTAKQ